MPAEVCDRPEAGRYEAAIDGELAGWLRYRTQPGQIALMHTETLEEHEGEGVGGDLVRRALDDARERGLAVLPFCPFVKSWLERHSEYLDLVPEDQRAIFGL